MHMLRSCALRLDPAEVVAVAVEWGAFEELAGYASGLPDAFTALLDHPDFPWPAYRPDHSWITGGCREAFVDRAAVKWAGDPDRLNAALCEGMHNEASITRLVDAGASIKLALVAATCRNMPNLADALLCRFSASPDTTNDRRFFHVLLAAISFQVKNARCRAGNSVTHYGLEDPATAREQCGGGVLQRAVARRDPRQRRGHQRRRNV